MVLDLLKGAMMSVELDRRERLVRCIEGRVWITSEGDPRDYVLNPGRTASFRGPGKMVVEAVEESRIAISAEFTLAVRINEERCLHGQKLRLVDA